MFSKELLPSENQQVLELVSKVGAQGYDSWKVLTDENAQEVNWKVMRWRSNHRHEDFQ